MTLRGIFRARGRLLMTVIGVAGCTALLLAAYGIRDSVAGVVSAQFDEVSIYDYLTVFGSEPDAGTLQRFAEGPGQALAEWQLLYRGNMDHLFFNFSDSVRPQYFSNPPDQVLHESEFSHI